MKQLLTIGRRMMCVRQMGLVAVVVASLLSASWADAAGVLRRHPSNGRYFTDDSGQAIFLTGSHILTGLQDAGPSSPPPSEDYAGYLSFLQSNNHNFIRMWVHEQARWDEACTSALHVSPHPFARTGPGTARDGLPKWDVNQFDSSYFARLRQRIIDAGARNIYVSIMLFNGFSIEDKGSSCGGQGTWDGHPFHRDNNINGIDGDPNFDGRGREVHTLAVSAVSGAQKAYIRQVIDAVNDLDNVLYEISNESGSDSVAWQYDLINYIKSYEAGKPKRHPVGMTLAFDYPNVDNGPLFNSPADWISPGDLSGAYVNDPPTANSGSGKVIIMDTDHIGGFTGDRVFVWKNFTRGNNTIFFDPYTNKWQFSIPSGFNFTDSRIVSARRNMGAARSYAARMNLAAAVPQGTGVCSTGFCLANPGQEYLVYQPGSGSFVVNLSGTGNTFSVEWYNPETGGTSAASPVTGGSSSTFTPPFGGDAVLYLKNTGTAPSSPVIGFSPSSLSFSALQNGASPANQTVNVSNAGTGTLTWTAVSNQSWLRLNGGSSASGTNSGSFSVSANPSGLGVATHSATITLTAPGAVSQTIAVSFAVSASPPAQAPVINRSPSAMIFAAQVNGANPSAQTVTIANSGGGTLTWSASANQSWVTFNGGAASASGTGSGGFTVEVRTAGLGVSAHQATITISDSGASNSPQTVSVTFNVTSTPPPSPPGAPRGVIITVQ